VPGNCAAGVGHCASRAARRRDRAPFLRESLAEAHARSRAGIEAAIRLRQLARLDRRRAVVAAVGSSFTLGQGIDPLALAR
jgi:hypothetical protein